MKILITTDWYTPAVNGVVTSVKNLQRELERRGHEVRILTLSQSLHSWSRDGVTAIGHHDDPTAFPVNPVAAALILADKTDVRRSRVRNKEHQSFDIHDRVNYAAERSELTLDPERRTLTLSLGINTEFCAVMDYFEIFLERMLLCRRAAEFLELTFKLDINGLSLL